MAKPPTDPDSALAAYLPHGCTCTDSEAAVACKRCKAQRERIRRLYMNSPQGRIIRAYAPVGARAVQGGLVGSTKG